MAVTEYVSSGKSKKFKVFVFLMILVIGVSIAVSTLMKKFDIFVLVFFFIYCCVIVGCLYQVLRVARKISIVDDSKVVAEGFMLRREFAVKDVLMIKDTGNCGDLTIVYGNNKVYVDRSTDGMYEFIFIMKNLNPCIVVKGC